MFEGDSQAAAAGVYRRAHIASFHSNAALPPDSDTTIAPLMMPRMHNTVNPAVPEVSIRRVSGGSVPPPHPGRPVRGGRGRSRVLFPHARARGVSAAPPTRSLWRPRLTRCPPFLLPRVVDGQTRVVQVASRVPNRLAGTELEGGPGPGYGLPGGAKPPSSSSSYPSLLLAEKEEEERARLAEARKREVEAKQRQADIRVAVAAGAAPSGSRQQSLGRAPSREELMAATSRAGQGPAYGDARKRTPTGAGQR